jgi:hypothetical protein
MEFTIMEKAGQRLVVHPDAVEETKALGWAILGTTANADDDPWEKPKKASKKEAPETPAAPAAPAK